MNATTSLKKTINLGEVDYDGRGWKINAVDIEVTLANGRLSMVGNIWNDSHTDFVCGGQCCDEIAKLFPGNPKVRRMVQIWRRWHLNDMRAGTPAQEAYLRDNPVSYAYPDSYLSAAKRALAAGGLEPDNGYSYGSAWLLEELPQEVIDEIKEW